MSPSHVAKASSATRSKTSRRKFVLYARSNLKPTVRRASEQIRAHAFAVRQLVRYLHPDPAPPHRGTPECQVVSGDTISTTCARLHRGGRPARDEREGALDPEPSLGARLGQIGVLGWADRRADAARVSSSGAGSTRAWELGVFFSAPLLMVGAAIGFLVGLEVDAPPGGKHHDGSQLWHRYRAAVGLVAGLVARRVALRLAVVERAAVRRRDRRARPSLCSWRASLVAALCPDFARAA